MCFHHRISCARTLFKTKYFSIVKNHEHENEKFRYELPKKTRVNINTGLPTIMFLFLLEWQSFAVDKPHAPAYNFYSRHFASLHTVLCSMYMNFRGRLYDWFLLPEQICMTFVHLSCMSQMKLRVKQYTKCKKVLS
jgi:hypothetical protein